MNEHNSTAWQDGLDAWQNGYDDAMYDGIDTSDEMPCRCEACRNAYAEGQEAAMKEIFSDSQFSGWITEAEAQARDYNDLIKTQGDARY